LFRAGSKFQTGKIAAPFIIKPAQGRIFFSKRCENVENLGAKGVLPGLRIGPQVLARRKRIEGGGIRVVHVFRDRGHIRELIHRSAHLLRSRGNFCCFSPIPLEHSGSGLAQQFVDFFLP